MKHLTTTLFVSVVMLSVTASAANAQGCNSAASVVADIWTKVHEVAYEVGCRAVTEVVTFGDGSARDGSNKGGLTGFYTDYSECFNTAGKLTNLTSKLVTFWNSKVNNSWATVGPRRLDLNQNHTGTLVSTGGRKFVSFPVFNKSSVTITIDETKGKGKTSVVVCKVNKDNQYSQVATRWFNNSKQRKKNKSEKHTVTVNGAKDHIIVVHLDGKSVANTFGYKLRAQ